MHVYYELADYFTFEVPGAAGDIKTKPGSLVGRKVDIDSSKEKSRKVREFIKSNQKRMANIKKGKGPIST